MGIADTIVNSNIKGMGRALHLFLETKPVGYEFTSASLLEDYMTDPNTSFPVTMGATTSFIKEQWTKGALQRKYIGNRSYAHILVRIDLLKTSNRTSKGGAPGRSIPNHRRGPFGENPEPKVRKPAKTLTIDQILGVRPIADPFAKVQLQIDEYIRHEVAMRVKVTKRDLTDIPDSDILAELTRRLGERK